MYTSVRKEIKDQNTHRFTGTYLDDTTTPDTYERTFNESVIGFARAHGMLFVCVSDVRDAINYNVHEAAENRSKTLCRVNGVRAVAVSEFTTNNLIFPGMTTETHVAFIKWLIDGCPDSNVEGPRKIFSGHNRKPAMKVPFDENACIPKTKETKNHKQRKAHSKMSVIPEEG